MGILVGGISREYAVAFLVSLVLDDSGSKNASPSLGSCGLISVDTGRRSEDGDVPRLPPLSRRIAASGGPKVI